MINLRDDEKALLVQIIDAQIKHQEQAQLELWNSYYENFAAGDVTDAKWQETNQQSRAIVRVIIKLEDIRTQIAEAIGE